MVYLSLAEKVRGYPLLATMLFHHRPGSHGMGDREAIWTTQKLDVNYMLRRTARLCCHLHFDDTWYDRRTHLRSLLTRE